MVHARAGGVRGGVEDGLGVGGVRHENFFSGERDLGPEWISDFARRRWDIFHT